VKLGNSKPLGQEHFRNVLTLSDRHNTKLTLLGSLSNNRTIAFTSEYKVQLTLTKSTKFDTYLANGYVPFVCDLDRCNLAYSQDT
jgi:hypothetical protein